MIDALIVLTIFGVGWFLGLKTRPTPDFSVSKKPTSKEPEENKVKNELKTLKDIEEYHNYDFDIEIIDKDELRQEAIKWIKDLREDIELYESKNMSKYIGGDQTSKRTDAVIIWIKHFFNLTEDDLE